jgi:hypothetical protein
MKTIVVKVPEKKANHFRQFLKRNHLKSQVIEKEEDEELLAKWISEGMKSGEVSEEEVFETLRKNGVKI